MKSIFMFTAAIFFLLVINLTAQDTLTILHVNDTHSMLAPMGPRTNDLKGTIGGIARAATVIGLTKMTESNVLAFHGGDAFVGDLFFNSYFGIAEFNILKSIGLDAMVVGNHEFDLGPAVLQMALDSSIANGGFSVVSSNIIMDDPSVSSLKKYIKPYVIKQVGNIKVGIFGLTTPSTNVQSLPAPVVIDTNIEACIVTALTSLAAENCNVIICLSHLGKFYDQQIAAAVPGINVIISAHDHSLTEKPIEVKNLITNKATYIVEADAFYTHVGKLKLIVNGSTVSKLSYELIPLDLNIPEEPTVAEIVNNLIAGIEAEYGIPFYTKRCGYANGDFTEIAEIPISKDGSTYLGKLLTGALKWKTGAEIGLTVGGLTTLPIYRGPLVPADLFRAIGYGFNEINKLGYRVMTFDIKGMDLVTALETCLAQVGMDDEFLPQLSGIEYSFSMEGSINKKITSIKINGNSIDLEKNYSVVSNEFLVTALQQLFSVPISNVSYVDSLTEFLALYEYVLVRDTILVSVVEKFKGKPSAYKLDQNYPNPFNPSTTIEFSVPKAQKVSLRIYNSLGQEVALLVNEELNAGVYKYDWTPKNLSSGIYFYQLTAGEYSDVKKLVFLK